MPSRRVVLALIAPLVAPLVAALPTGCASPNPTLFTLAVVPGTPRAGAPRVIELRSIALARYLERSQIVRSSEDFRLDVSGNDWWGEPLDAMLGRVLVQELTDRLPGSTVFPENGAISATPDATVGVNIQRLDADRTGAVVLVAQIAISGRRTATRSVRLTVMPEAPGTPGLVGAMNAATAQLADTIAGMLAGS
ncbi:MAG: PqiC family protein [Acetobacteraceae bacterium]